jgi:hypothetical protein
MSERKGEEMMATGVHRAWAGESSGSVVRAGASREPQRNWLERSQTSVNPRHAAITRSLYSWSSYKSWTDRVRSSWDKDTKSGK